MLTSAVKAAWPLLFGILLIMVGNGLQGSLLGVRAGLESFSTASIGAIMSCFYLGFLLGSAATPRLIVSVGHIRVFSAWASLASGAVLVHALLPHPIVWAVLRFATGFAYAGMYVVAESWLNDRVDNRSRGQLLSLYMIIQYGGLAGGQLLLNAGDASGATLFLIVSVLVSAALIPISLSSRPAPLFETSASVSYLTLLKQTPTGFVGCVLAGAMTGCILGMGTVYAQSAGFDVRQTSLLMAAAIGGGALLQFPVGRLSDRLWRTDVIVGVAGGAVVVAVATALLEEAAASPRTLGFVLTASLLLPIHALVLALANDRLRPEQMVAAGSGLVMAFGLGAALGPVGVAIAMERVGPDGFFWVLAGLAGVLALGGLRTRGMLNQGKADFLPTPMSSPHTPEEIAEANGGLPV